MDAELIYLLSNASGPMTIERIAARLGVNISDANKCVREAVTQGLIRNTCESTVPTYAINNGDKSRIAQPPSDDIFSRDTYPGDELTSTGSRPEAKDTHEIPSRIGDWLVYRGGRKERIA